MEDENDLTNPGGEQDLEQEVEQFDDDFEDHDPDQSENGEGDGDAEEPVEEVEYGGKKFKVPAALKPALMLQEDYTRKTQQLADERRAFEQERQRHAEVENELREDYGRVHALKAQVAAFKEIDWAVLSANDPVEAQSLWMTFQQVQQTLTEAENSLKAKIDQRLQDQRQAVAKAMEETGKVLASEIKGWSPALAQDLAKFAIERYGVSREELIESPDPRLWKLLHDAYQGAKAQKHQRVTNDQRKLEKVRPAAQVGRRQTPPRGLSDDLPADEWFRRREAEVARRGR